MPQLVTLNEDRDAWERQKYETGKAFEAFALYRDLGPSRTQAEVARKLGKGRRQMSVWAGLYLWDTRAAEYDRYTDARARAELENDRLESRRKRIGVSKALQRLARRGLKAQNPEGREETYTDENGNERTRWLQRPWTADEVIRAIQVAHSELRKDYDDEPAMRVSDTPRDEGTAFEIARAMREVSATMPLAEMYDHELGDEAEGGDDEKGSGGAKGE